MRSVVNCPLIPNTIAKGDPPVHGQDSQIKMYEIESPKPKLIENDKLIITS